MIAEIIGFSLRNLPAILFVLAFPCALLHRNDRPLAERLLSWLLLLPIGGASLWAGIYHVFFPATAAAYIGWQASPFQLEVGMADLAIGATACAAFWRDVEFQAAIVTTASIYLLGDAIGHVRQMMTAGNFAPGNAGVPFYLDIVCPLLAIALLLRTRREARQSR